MKRVVFFLSLLALCCCGKPDDEGIKPPPASEPEETLPMVVVGYATYWDTEIPDPTLLTHINYSFAHIKDDFETLDIKKPNRFQTILALKEQKPDLKILLSVGGWGAGNFSEMAADPTHRRNFCNNCLVAVKTYGLDGIDLDWEYPTSSAAGISSSPNDTKNFTLLVKELREVLGENRLLTMASAANAKYVDFASATQYFDFINIMAYSMGDPPKHNAALYPSSASACSCRESVEYHFNKGVPYNKMVLGMPFYGHGNGKEVPESVDYKELGPYLKEFTRKWDSISKVPYLVNDAGKMILTYDDEESIALKADYIKYKGLRGAMYWNIEADDDTWTLSKVVATRLLESREPGTSSESLGLEDIVEGVKPVGSAKLSGLVIGSKWSVDYDNGDAISLTANTKDKVFDGDFNTFFSSYDGSRTWVGLDLGEKHVITKIGYSPRMAHEDRVELAMLEGANNDDFSDALPLLIIKNGANSGVMTYSDVTCSRGFRYVRYVSPTGAHCNLAELEFYGCAGDGDDSRLYQLTNLPTVVVNIENGEEVIEKTKDLISNVYIISENGTDLLSTSGTEIRGRGNASWGFPKKPYRLKFDSKQSPLGAPASAKKWTLINNYGDKTLMRNILAFEVSRRVGQSYTPFCQPVDLIINGEYRGCYQFCDQVEAAKGRVDAKDGYLIEIDAYAHDEDVYFDSAKGTPVTIKHPDEDDITQEQIDFITDYFNTMEASVFASDFTDPENGYRKWLDLDSFLRNFIIGEFCGNTDTFWSVYMYKDAADGKLYTGPAWDYDIAFENDKRTCPINDLTDWLYYKKGSLASRAMKDMVSKIVKEDPEAKKRLVEIWKKACSDGKLTELNSYLDQTAALLQESQELNFKRWKILSEKVHQNFQALGSYDAEVQTVKDYITGRLVTFDKLVSE